MTDQEYLTLKEISRITDVPESACRYCRDNFSEFLLCKGSGRSRRFHKDTVPLFKQIYDCREKGMDDEDIRNDLAGNGSPEDVGYPKEITQIQLPLPIAGIMPMVKDFVADLIPSATNVIRNVVQDTLAESVADFKEQKEDIRILQDEIKEQKAENQALKNKLSELENKISQLFSQEKTETSTKTIMQSKGKRPDKKAKEEIIKRVRKIRGQGLTYKKIAQRLNQDGIPTLSGQVGPSAWKEGTVGRILNSL